MVSVKTLCALYFDGCEAVCVVRLLVVRLDWRRPEYLEEERYQINAY